VIASIVLAIQTFIIPHNAYQFSQMQRSLLTLGGAMVGIIAAVMLLNHYFPRRRCSGKWCWRHRPRRKPRTSVAARPWPTTAICWECAAQRRRNWCRPARP